MQMNHIDHSAFGRRLMTQNVSLRMNSSADTFGAECGWADFSHNFTPMYHMSQRFMKMPVFSMIGSFYFGH
jgi:hypothetical protein